MLFRNRAADPSPSETPAEPTAPASGKGRPTPRRSEAEAARRRPLVPADRRGAAKAQKAALRAERDREYQALRSGDEKNMPYRDRGPVRRWIRDYVDARRNLGELFLPVALVLVFANLVTANNLQAGLIVIAVLYAFVLATIVDALVLSRKLRKALNARFGEAKVPRGSIMYGVLRAFQIRRTRLPRPKVSRGQFPS